MSKVIAVVDDEPDIVELISLALQKAGFEVAGFYDAESFFRYLPNHSPQLILLDLMLPDADGLEVCKHLKSKPEWSSIPIIMVTARGDEADRVLGLELGADDYVTKPFSARELVARVKAVLRRQTKIEEMKKIEVEGILVIDPGKHEVISGRRKVDLTSTEFKILSLLAAKKGRVFTREQILDQLWGQEKIVLDRTVDVHIRNLRAKLGAPAASLIKNVRGVGYKLEG
ncbi:MAG: response regulator [Candidatus Aminicenantales bacterium]